MFRGQLLFKSCIDRNYAAEYTEKVRRHNNVNIMLSGQYITYIIPCEERFRDKMYDMFHNHVVEVQSFSEIDDDIYKIGFYSFDSADSLVLPECDFSQMYLAYSENNWKEFIRSGVNKGQAVKFAMNFFNIPADNSIAFGDNYNDIEMLQSVKYGFAVKNCKFEIEKVCENTTDSVESTLRKVFFTN